VVSVDLAEMFVASPNAANFFHSRAFFRTVAVLVVGLCAFVRIVTAGWGFLVLTVICVYPAISLLHLWFTAVKIPETQELPSSTRHMLWVSHMLLVAAALLQYDEGYGSGWLTATELLRIGRFEMKFPILWDLVLFVPVLASWVLLWKTWRHEE
jgi:hypothetical protein